MEIRVLDSMKNMKKPLADQAYERHSVSQFGCAGGQYWADTEDHGRLWFRPREIVRNHRKFYDATVWYVDRAVWERKT